VIQPYPERTGLAAVDDTGLSLFQNDALISPGSFSDSLVYRAYAAAPAVLGLAPMNDQVFAGALMWVSELLFIFSPP
jgi:hypothetical protein